MNAHAGAPWTERPNRRRALALAGAAVGGAWGFLNRRTHAAAAARLLPPGARATDAFYALCIRCGQCVQACPVEALKLGATTDGLIAGAPHVETRTQSCNLCMGRDALLCISACPTGALAPVARRNDVRMGRAFIDEARCLAYNGTVCRACWHACPFPDVAIRLGPRARPVIEDACVGCGLCDHACLSEPSSIHVVPRGSDPAEGV